jgi:hypothetical protein
MKSIEFDNQSKLMLDSDVGALILTTYNLKKLRQITNTMAQFTYMSKPKCFRKMISMNQHRHFKKKFQPEHPKAALKQATKMQSTQEISAGERSAASPPPFTRRWDRQHSITQRFMRALKTDKPFLEISRADSPYSLKSEMLVTALSILEPRR